MMIKLVYLSKEIIHKNLVLILIIGFSIICKLLVNKEIELSCEPKFTLHENYPNPFNPTTTMRFDLPIQTDAKIMIFNMLGQKVKTFDLKGVSAYHSVKWNARNDLGDPVRSTFINCKLKLH